MCQRLGYSRVSAWKLVAVRGGEERLVGPLIGKLSEPLDELAKWTSVATGQLVGGSGGGVARPARGEALRWNVLHALKQGCTRGHRNQEIKVDLLANVLEQLCGEVLAIGQYQGRRVGALRVENGGGHIEQLGCGLGDRARRGGGGEAQWLMGIRIQSKEGLRYLGRLGIGVFVVAAHLAFAVAADAVGVDGEKLATEIARGAAQFSQSDLQALGIKHSARRQQLVDCLITADKGQAVGELKALLGQAALVTDSIGAERRLVNELKGQTGLGVFAIACAPSAQEIPCPQTQVLGHQ